MTTLTQTETFSVRLPDDLKTELDRVAATTKRSRSFIVKEAVATYIRERKDYIREIDEAVTSAENGVGHSSEQIFEWMRTWGTPHELASPKPDIRPARK